MRLLSTKTLELTSFPDRNGETPRYAILSHRWSANADDEVLYADIQNGKASTKTAYDSKLAKAMEQARKASHPSERFDWIWCDTCCIDKSSSAELSESINSMYAWYESAAVCYAYIDDKAFTSISELKESKWFTRGWTLQELIAPTELIFFDCHWTRIGSKKFPAIRDMVSERTGIDADILTGDGSLHSHSVAKRMSWAADRNVTRPEDIAYCLLGIFQINMPMLYGEGGQNAFHRLQEQIMKDSNDHSIFAWTADPDAKMPKHHGLLADHPKAFRNASNIVGYHDWEDDQPYQPSNRGLRIDLHLTPVDGTEDVFYAALNCPIPSRERGYYGFVAIYLKKLASGVHSYARVSCHEIRGLETRARGASTIYVRQKAATEDDEAVLPWHFFAPRNLTTLPSNEYELLNVAYYPLDKNEQQYAPRPMLRNTPWLAAAQASAFHIIKRAGRLSAVLYFRRKSDQSMLSILMGSIFDLEVGFDVAIGGMDLRIDELERKMRLQPMGETMEAGTHKVRIDTMIKIDTPRKLYVLDLTIYSEAVQDVPRQEMVSFRPPPATAQAAIQANFNDIGNDVIEALAGPDSYQYRPMALLKRASKKGGKR